MKKNITLGAIILGLFMLGSALFVKPVVKSKPPCKDTVIIIEEAHKDMMNINSKPEPVQNVNDVNTNPIVPADVAQGVGVNYNWNSR